MKNKKGECMKSSYGKKMPMMPKGKKIGAKKAAGKKMSSKKGK